MQRDTFCPGLIRNITTGELWWLRWDDDGERRYHKRPDDQGHRPSYFYNFEGELKQVFRGQ